MEFTHGIPGTILRSRFTNAGGGISDTHEHVTVVGPDVPHVDEVRPSAPAVFITDPVVPAYRALRPVREPHQGGTEYMSSGAWVAPSEGCPGAREAWRQVFGHYLPIPLHDRTETWTQYRQLSG